MAKLTDKLQIDVNLKSIRDKQKLYTLNELKTF